ncbi:MAG: DUF1906 domain-containing protein [Propionibacteriales bacterium]|nr:DUF1906 domain-containing protein [Propionibacteriales bacterium]
MSVRLISTSALACVLALALLGPLRGDVFRAEEQPLDLAAAGTNPVTPGNFTGYGFDQCLTPTQATMDAWLEHSPFHSVGIYISGNSRACRNQPNLTPTWVSTQLAKGWRLLPITLGPQASCSSRYPKYDDDPKINPDATNYYAKAKAQGKLEAERAVNAATALGLTPGSTLFYDLEAFDIGNTKCRESAIRFVHAWTIRLHELNFVSGYYSSAGSGIKMLDDVLKTRPTAFVLPDQVWVARWDGKANTTISSSYLSPSAWAPGRRVKQFQGGHDETWGGVKINIDRNYLDLGNSTPKAEKHCSGVRVDLSRYLAIKPATATVVPNPDRVKALQCLLRERGLYPTDAPINGKYGPRTLTAAQAWQTKRGFTASTTWSVRDWITILSAGAKPVLKIGSRGGYVRRAQRAIQAAHPALEIKVTGIYDTAMAADVLAYRKKIGVHAYGVLNTATWTSLQAGKY